MSEDVPSITAAAVAFTAVVARDMRKLEPEARKAIRPKLRAAGQVVRVAAAANASWSTRIPGALSVTTSFRVNRESVKVTVNQKAAPHARPFEGLTTRGDTFRHPVFGHGGSSRRRVVGGTGFYDSNTWVAQATRPFLLTAAAATAPTVNQMMRDALEEAAAATQSGG